MRHPERGEGRERIWRRARRAGQSPA
jgi:hypothetical protein